jgi:hypothetical protein
LKILEDILSRLGWRMGKFGEVLALVGRTGGIRCSLTIVGHWIGGTPPCTQWTPNLWLTHQAGVKVKALDACKTRLLWILALIGILAPSQGIPNTTASLHPYFSNAYTYFAATYLGALTQSLS